MRLFLLCVCGLTLLFGSVDSYLTYTLGSTTYFSIPTSLTEGTGGIQASITGLLLGASAFLWKVSSGTARGKRDTGGQCMEVGNAEVFFTLAKNSNTLDCGRRFVCELEATDSNLLSREEQLVRSVFRSSYFEKVNKSSAQNFFKLAGAVGIHGGIGACKKTFHLCPFDRRTLYHMFLQNTK